MNLGLQVITCYKEEDSKELEYTISKVKNIKQFVKDNSNNQKLINDYMTSIQPMINKINNTFQKCQHARRNINISKLANKNQIKKYIKRLREILL